MSFTKEQVSKVMTNTIKISEFSHYTGHRKGEIVTLTEALTRIGFADLARSLTEHNRDTLVGWFGVAEARSGKGLNLTTEGFGPLGPDGKRVYQEQCVDTRAHCGGQCLFGFTAWRNWGTEQAPNWGPTSRGVYVVMVTPPDRSYSIVLKLAWAA